MVISSELRLGNYILVDNIVRQVSAIKNDNDEQSYSIGFEENHIHKYEPANSERLIAVPISDQILTQLGFTFHDYHKTWQHEKPKKTSAIELDKDYTAVDFARRTLLKNVKYLHLLQNLFFSVQREELVFRS